MMTSVGTPHYLLGAANLPFGGDHLWEVKQPVKLAVKALLEVVQLGGKNLEVAVMRVPEASQKGRNLMVMLPVDEIEKYVAEIEEEKEKEAAAKRPAGQSSE